MDVYTYNPSTTALESIFRSSGFPLFRTPSWTSLSNSSSNGFNSTKKTMTALSPSMHKEVEDPVLRRGREEPGLEGEDVEMAERDPEPGSVPIVAAKQGGLGAAAAPAPVPAPALPAPWMSRDAGGYEPPRTATPLPEIKLAPRAQADTNSQLDSYLHFLAGHTLGVSDLRTMSPPPASATDAPNPMSGLGEPPAVSSRTFAITGILVDVFGLDDLPPLASLTHVSVLWLHNPRLGDRTRMYPMAKRVVHEYNRTRPAASTRGLIAVAFDQRNHGVREVHHLANLTWKKGNIYHAQDMFGIVSGTVVDTRLLIDALPGYLFLDSDSRPNFDQHICMGVSLGGHSTWQTLFTDPRVTAGVSIIGCPDFQFLMKDRARLSKLSTYDKSTGGASFLGSKDFPSALVTQCAQFDPKGIVFGIGDVVEAPATEAEQAPLRRILDRHVRGKRFLMCTGGDDKLVPWRCSESFTKFFVYAAETWYKDSGLTVDNRIYKGKGHECSDEMVVDAVKFVCEVVNDGPSGIKTEGLVGARI